MALGLLPLMAWALFATVYYGSPVPNTAIAKLGVSLPRNEVLGQGLRYVFVTVERDPLTVFVLLAGIVCGSSRRVTRPLAIGVLLQVVYVVWVGGDFMAGRFLTAPFFLSLAICVTLLDALDAKYTQVALAVVAFVAVLSPYRPFEEVPPDREIPASGIVSEREFYREELGLGANLRKRAYRQHSFYRQGVAFRKEPERVVYFENAGFAGYAAGPNRHLVDAAGLTDAFLARMPRETQREWRIGHYGREVPAGYLPTLRTGKMKLTEARHRELYGRLRLIAGGPIFSVARLEAIAWMHLNRFGVEH
jgi:arabinofuranosyltransferase